MDHSRRLTGAALAMLAAGALLSAPASQALAADAKKVHCEGVNSCKGHNDCKSARNECKGKGACKGQGFLVMTADECKAKGGKVAKT